MPRARKRRLDHAGRERLSVEVRSMDGQSITVGLVARPGSFEWRAARGYWTPAQVQAGRVARAIWEAQGVAQGLSVNLATEVAGGSREAPTGPQEGVLRTLWKAGRLRAALGTKGEARLKALLLLDVTVAELAQAWGIPAGTRAMTEILRHDLTIAANVLGYEPGGLGCEILIENA